MKFSLEELKKKPTISTSSKGNTSLATLRQDLKKSSLESRINSLAVKNIDNAALERRNNATELIFILDASGSCSGLEASTIKGVNDLIEAEKKTGAIVKVSIVLFNNYCSVLCERVDINMVPKFSYKAQDGTALYDTLCTELSSLKAKQTATGDIKPEKTIVAIMTDGQDEHSRMYGLSDARAMIQSCRQIGWKFIFLGSEKDAKMTASSLGIDPKYAEQYLQDKEGVLINFQSVRKALVDLRNDGKINPNWAADIREHNNVVAPLQIRDNKSKILRLTGGNKHE